MNNKIRNWYFTYGSWEGFPFQGGWTKIEAPSRHAAVAIFRAFHPDKTEGIVCCADIYDEENFQKSRIWTEGNEGKHEVEMITMQYFNIERIQERNKAPWED